MSTLRRTLLALPVAVLAVAMFAATSPGADWLSWDSDVARVEVTTDVDGRADGLVTVVVVGPIRDSMDIRITLRGEDVRRSLDVAPADGSQQPGRVRDGISLFRGLPRACEAFGQGGSDTDDTDEDGNGELNSCTVEVRLAFEGRSEVSDSVTLEASVGSWEDEDRPRPGDTWIIEVDYDANPPVE